MGKILKVTGLLCLLPALLFGSGETAADVLKVDAGVRTTGLGCAYAAAGDDVESVNYNPAGIAAITMREFQFNFNSNFTNTVNISVYNLLYSQPLETSFLEGNVAVEALYRNLPNISNPDATDAAVSYYDLFIKGTYGVNFAKINFLNWDNAKYLNVGISAALVMQQISTYSSSQFVFDLGAQYNLYDTGFRLGLSLQNLGFPMKLISEESPMPALLRAGVSYATKLSKDNSLLVETDYIQDFYDYARIAAGVEDTIMDALYLRLGYNTYVDTRNTSYLSAGTGFKVSQLGGVIVILNYTYRLMMLDGFNGAEHSHLAALQVKL